MKERKHFKSLILILLIMVGILSSCSHYDYKTIKIVKPRTHKSWYKNHVHRKRIEVGRVKIKLFEKQGVKTVRARM